MKSYKHFGDQVRRNLSSLFKHRVGVRKGSKDWVKNESNKLSALFLHLQKSRRKTLSLLWRKHNQRNTGELWMKWPGLHGTHTQLSYQYKLGSVAQAKPDWGSPLPMSGKCGLQPAPAHDTCGLTKTNWRGTFIILLPLNSRKNFQEFAVFIWYFIDVLLQEAVCMIPGARLWPRCSMHHEYESADI